MYRRLPGLGHYCSPVHDLDVDLKHIVFWLTTKIFVVHSNWLIQSGWCCSEILSDSVVRLCCDSGILCLPGNKWPCAGARIHKWIATWPDGSRSVVKQTWVTLSNDMICRHKVTREAFDLSQCRKVMSGSCVGCRCTRELLETWT